MLWEDLLIVLLWLEENITLSLTIGSNEPDNDSSTKEYSEDEHEHE